MQIVEWSVVLFTSYFVWWELILLYWRPQLFFRNKTVLNDTRRKKIFSCWTLVDAVQMKTLKPYVIQLNFYFENAYNLAWSKSTPLWFWVEYQLVWLNTKTIDISAKKNCITTIGVMTHLCVKLGWEGGLSYDRNWPFL